MDNFSGCLTVEGSDRRESVRPFYLYSLPCLSASHRVQSSSSGGLFARMEKVRVGYSSHSSWKCHHCWRTPFDRPRRYSDITLTRLVSTARQRLSASSRPEFSWPHSRLWKRYGQKDVYRAAERLPPGFPPRISPRLSPSRGLFRFQLKSHACPGVKFKIGRTPGQPEVGTDVELNPVTD